MFRLTKEEQFTEWRNTIDLRLNHLAGLISWDLDYSLESLDELETWLLGKYSHVNAARVLDEYPTIDACGTYVGELLRRKLGGDWVIELKDQEYGYLGIPGVGGFRGSLGVPVYPVTWVTTSLDRRTGVFLRKLSEKRLK